MLVYHGSEGIIRTPAYKEGNRTKDFGYGFYTTEQIELAKEWACGWGNPANSLFWKASSICIPSITKWTSCSLSIVYTVKSGR